MLPILFCFLSATVNTNNFRSCNDMRFCSENLKKTATWSVEKSTAKLSSNKKNFSAKVYVNGNDSGLLFEISAIKTGGFRFCFSPLENESFNRYILTNDSHVINKETIEDNEILTMNEKEGSLIITADGEKYSGLSVNVACNPLKISVRKGNDIIIDINKDGQLLFEHHLDVEVPSESFNGFTDVIPNGPTAVGADFTFYGNNVRLSGLSERASQMNLADTEEVPLRLFNTDTFEYEADNPFNLYGSIPFLYAHSKELSSAIFWMNPSDTFVDISSKDNERKAHFISEGGYLDFVVFVDDYKGILKSYCEITGYPMFAPLFAHGYHQSRWGYETQHEIGVVIRSMDELNIPFDSIWLDIEHLIDRTPFTMNLRGFPDPMKLFNTLGNDDRYIVKVTDPHFPNDNENLQARELRKKHYLVNQSSGIPFVGESWPGQCVFPDFLNPSVLHWYTQQFSYENDIESSMNVFYWNDMNEPSIFKGDQSTFPKGLIHFGGYENREVHNIYGLLNTAGTYEGILNRSPDHDRPFVLTRSYFSGSQKYAWSWTGDNAASWEHLAISLPMILTNGICGMPFTGADVGGFLKSPDAALLIRWFQLAAWTYPFFRQHCHHKSWRREPFMFDGEEQDIMKNTIIDRYKMLPLWYTASFKSSITGVSPVVPLFTIFPDNDDLHDIDNAAILGESLYVVPVLEDDVDEIEVVKPPGIWYCFFNGTKLEEDTNVVPVTLEKIPIYIRGGKIVSTFTQVEKSSLSTLIKSSLTLYIALDENKEATGDLFFDDGISFQYLNGSFIHRFFTFKGNTLKVSNYNNKDGSPTQTNIPSSSATLFIDNIIIYGLSQEVKSSIGTSTYNEGTLVINSLTLSLNEDWELQLQ